MWVIKSLIVDGKPFKHYKLHLNRVGYKVLAYLRSTFNVSRLHLNRVGYKEKTSVVLSFLLTSYI